MSRIKVFQNDMNPDNQLVHRTPLMVGSMTELSALDLAYSIYCFMLGDASCNSKDEVLYEIVHANGYGKRKEKSLETGKNEEVHFETFTKVPGAVLDHLTQFIEDPAPKHLGLTIQIGAGHSVVRQYRDGAEIKPVTTECVSICITKVKKK